MELSASSLLFSMLPSGKTSSTIEVKLLRKKLEQQPQKLMPYLSLKEKRDWKVQGTKNRKERDLTGM